MQNKKQTLLHVVFIACFAFLAMSSSYYNGITLGNDSHQHFQFAQTVQATVASGDVYPSFSSAPNHGYGDVGLRFYPPLVYYVLSGFFFAFGSWYAASLTTFTLIFFLSGIGVYFWAREEFSAAQSLLAAALYVFAPHHLNQIYNSFLLAEFAATVAIPFCFLFLTRVCRKGKLTDVFGLAIAYAVLILTHLPMTIVGSMVFPIFALVLMNRKTFLQTSLKLAAAVGGALAATSFYWLRMATELDWVNHSAQTYFSDQYSFNRNFLLKLANFTNFKTDVEVLWLADLMLLVMLFISIPSAIYFFKERKNLSAYTKALAVVFAVSIFLTTALSAFVWNNFSLLQKVQFPWRWLGIVSMVGAVFASTGIIKVSEKMKHSKNWLLPIGLGIVCLSFVTLSSFITKEAFFVSPEDFNKTLAAPDTLSFECWWTKWSKTDALQVSEKVVANGRNYEIRNWQPLEREFKIAAGEATEIRVATFYYPHWQATVNGETIAVKPDENGAILIPIAEQAANVKLVFREPYFVRIANYVSIFVWLILGIGTIVLLFGKPSEIESQID